MANYIHFENWTAEQVAGWLRGMDSAIQPYVQSFLNNNIDGKKLLMLNHADLDKLNVKKFGHQELILEAVDILRTMRYGYETENLQYLALQLCCKARSLQSEIQQLRSTENNMNVANIPSQETRSQKLPIQVLSSVADILITLKTLVSWLDRAPFLSMYDLCLRRNTIVKTGLDIVTVCQKEANITDMENAIIKSCRNLSNLCDDFVVTTKDPLVIQPASLEVATIRKTPDEELGMHIQSYGIHVIGAIKDRSPADICGKIEKGDEVIQVNYQTVIGWQLQNLVDHLKEKPKEVVLLLKKRPRHISTGQVQKKKLLNKHGAQAATLPKSLKKRRSRDGEAKPVRPSLQEIVSSAPADQDELYSPREPTDGNDTDNDVFRSGSESPQFTLPVQVDPKQRRATVSGGSPTLSRPLLVIEDLDTPTRPKSFTIATDSPPGDFSNERISASQKRQDFKAAKSVPQSLEFTVKKPTAQKPSAQGVPLKKSPGTPEVKVTFESIEVPLECDVVDLSPPAVFSEPELEAQSSSEPSETDIAIPAEKKYSQEKVKTEEPSPTDIIAEIPSKEQHIKAVEPEIKAELPSAESEIKAVVPSKEPEIKAELPSKEPEIKAELPSKEPEIEVTLTKGPEEPLTQESSKDQVVHRVVSSFPKTAPCNLQSVYVEKPKSQKLSAEVARDETRWDQPQLMKIKKLESIKLSDMEPKPVIEQSPEITRKVQFAQDVDKKHESTSYTHIVVGGVVQRIPTKQGGSTSSPKWSPTSVTMRPKEQREKTRKKVDRRISCKDLGLGDCQGWLLKRRDRSGGPMSKNWHKRWCVLKNENLFYFKMQKDLKAEGVIHLPAFQVSPAPEHKSKKFAFKIHNLGTSFHFASERQDDMSKWMNRLGLASINCDTRRVKHTGGFSKPGIDESTSRDQGHHNLYYSESEDDDDSSTGSVGSPTAMPRCSHETSSRSAGSSSPASQRSNESSPGTHSKDGLDLPNAPDCSSVEDLTVMYREIEKQNLGIDGRDKNKTRRSCLTSLDILEAEEQSSDKVEKLRKLLLLQRTLKDKEQELVDIEHIFKEKLTPKKMDEFHKIHPSVTSASSSDTDDEDTLVDERKPTTHL